MYSYIKGQIVSVNEEACVIEAQGVGYRIYIAPNHALKLPLGKSTTMMHLSFVIREFSQALYGFLEEVERDLFEQLLNISGIGPKLALSIIGHLPPLDLKDALLSKDIQTLCKVPGIGKKTAERLLLELKESVFSLIKTPSNHVSAKNPPLLQDAVSALTNLGYSQMAAHRAVTITLENFADNSDLATIITHALRQI